jgi:uncharacterized membrane protein YecN with MAPEG domain
MAAYVGAVLVLFLKVIVTVSVQGMTRMRTRTFRHAEDAANWGGTATERESDLVVRAQHVLRNDGETQPFFLVFGALYVALGASPAAALVYFPGYALTRVAHTWLLLRPRQPWRNRAFGAGLALLLALAVHVAVVAARPLLG